MKSLGKIGTLCLLAGLLTSCATPRNAIAQYGGSVSIDRFYDELSPYGQWVPNSEYGSVWIPDVEPGFQPYGNNGHWVVTDYGNTWVSDYAWGWAPFHYGRWFFDDRYGWAWVPDNEWGPAWVNWRSGGGYYGWAPLGPGINTNINVNIPSRYWVFVPQVYITSPRLYSYCVPRNRVVNIYQNTTIINNYYRTNNRAYVYGPRRNEIEYVTRQRVPVYRIDNLDRPGRSQVRDGSVRFYRPEVSGNWRNTERPTRPGTAYSQRNSGSTTPSGRSQSRYNENNPTVGDRPTRDASERSGLGQDRPTRSERAATPRENTGDVYAPNGNSRPGNAPEGGFSTGRSRSEYARPGTPQRADAPQERIGQRPDQAQRNDNVERPSSSSQSPQRPAEAPQPRTRGGREHIEQRAQELPSQQQPQQESNSGRRRGRGPQ
ncbi:MAG: hypothetical protein LH606_00640 [Cytophagaceae bacterium]|nr:hypothetical protein [Cytophagaceae bacterium]